MFWIIFFGFISVLMRIKDWVFSVSNGMELTESYFGFTSDVSCIQKQWRDTNNWEWKCHLFDRQGNCEKIKSCGLPQGFGSSVLWGLGFCCFLSRYKSRKDCGKHITEKFRSQYDSIFILNFVAWWWSAWAVESDRCMKFSSATLWIYIRHWISLSFSFLICRMGDI